MEDRHVKELSAALKVLGSAISSAGLSIMFGLMYVGCMISMHH